MDVMVLTEPLVWPPADTDFMQELCHDWHGESLAPAARFGLIEDPRHLWLVAGRKSPANPHPTGFCGDFQEELWRHDVAELFIARAGGGDYLEFNLSPTGAWWMAAFSAPRKRSPLDILPAVRCEARQSGSGGWLAALGIPLSWLANSIDWGRHSRANVSFILESPRQRFLSACDLGKGEPDFHRPQDFERVIRHSG